MALDPVDDALVAALRRHGAARETISRDELAERAGVHPAVIDAVAREGLLDAVEGEGDDARFDPADVEAVSSGMALVEAGLPLGELLDLARRSDDALRGLAERAVDVFLEFIRDPARAGDDDGDAPDRLVRAFETMLPATRGLVGQHFEHLVLDVARERLEAELA